MNYETMTPAQVGVFVQMFSEQLAARGLNKATVDQALENPSLLTNMNRCVRELTDAIECGDGTVSRRVEILNEESQLPLETLQEITHYNEYDGCEVPPCTPGVSTIVFFQNTNRIWNHEALRREYAMRGLDPAHPLALAKACNREWPGQWFRWPVTFWSSDKGMAYLQLTSFWHYCEEFMPSFTLRRLRLSCWPKGTTFAGTPKLA
jgi:hypothetical protein